MVFVVLAFAVGCNLDIGVGATGPAAEAAADVRPESYGAVGDGRADDTGALQKALDALAPGQALEIAEGRTYRHTATLRIRRAGVKIEGPGTLLATNEEASSVWVQADNVTLEGGLVLRMEKTTKRWSGHEQMKLRLAGHSGAVVRNVIIDGSAAAGIYIGQADHFTLSDVRVLNTRADGIHMTAGSHDGQVLRPHVSGAGDDGVAVVSYAEDNALVRNITVESPIVENNLGGRGLSVVGGDEITFRNVNVVKSRAAGVYIATEGDPHYTFAPHRIRFLGGTLTASNTNTAAQHGAILVYSGRSGYTVDDVLIDGLSIVDTRGSAPWQVGAIGPGGFANIRLTNIAITRGSSRVFSSQAGRALTASGWTVNGRPYSPR